MIRHLTIAVLLVLGAIANAENKVVRESLTFQGHKRTYYVFVPQGLSAPAPMIVTFHGSGRNGQSLVDSWKDFASQQGIILVGLDAADSNSWRTKDDPPLLIREMVEAIKAKYSVDAKRIYLFGHSGGAIYALYLALMQPNYFAAAAIHAGAFLKDPGPLDTVPRKIPVGIWVGTRDPFFPVDRVRATRDTLKAYGFPVELKEIAGHDHNYYNISDSIDRQAWDFLKQTKLEGEQELLLD